MVERTIIEYIKQEEVEFPKRFASYEEKDYGILFYMADNKDSYDGNHACIYPERIEDLGAVLDDIADFYGRLGIRASIYHPYVKDYFKDNEAILNAHGFTYTPEEDHRVMLLVEENRIKAPKRLEIRVLKEWDERVATDILLPSGEPWEVDVTRKRIEQDGAYLFVGYLGEQAVVYTDIHKSDYNNTRFDYIVTAKAHRGKGYAGELLSFVIEYCKENGFPTCWQWAGPSEHICYRAGFREMFTMEAGFATGPERKNNKK
ncbi:MAG: GNAT family N-acetyltransferase [Lachnospiraceae bacterium]|nr:GNAT family N-acetyltransferase [Lachnospiraceae bacterium]